MLRLARVWTYGYAKKAGGLRNGKSARTGDRRHPEAPPYRCFLSDLTGFGGLRCAGPARAPLGG